MSKQLRWLVHGTLVCQFAVSLQSQPAGPPEFEAVSVKPIDPSAVQMMGIQVRTGGRIVLSGLSLKALIAAGFALPFWQITGTQP